MTERAARSSGSAGPPRLTALPGRGVEDGGTAGGSAETVSFALDGAHYEIDLDWREAEELRSELERYVRAARPVGRMSGQRGRPLAQFGIETEAVRAWATSRGIPLAGRGRIPAAVLQQYRAAT